MWWSDFQDVLQLSEWHTIDMNILYMQNGGLTRPTCPQVLYELIQLKLYSLIDIYILPLGATHICVLQQCTR